MLVATRYTFNDKPLFFHSLGSAMRLYICLCLFITATSSTMLAHASNLSFLSNTSIGNLTKTERADLRDFVIEALDNQRALEKSEWKSKKGSQALFKVLADYQYQEEQCRSIKFAVRASNQRRYQSAVWNLCRTGKEWRKIEAPLARLSEAQRTAIKSDLFSSLETGENGHPVTFNYPEVGLQVVATPFDAKPVMNQSDSQCRSLSVSIFDKNAIMLSGSYRFCFVAKEGWQYVPEE